MTGQLFIGSWHLKLSRAEKHLEEFNSLVREFAAENPYSVLKVVETDDDGHDIFAYRLDLPKPNAAWMGPVIAGDVLFNIRSALDHLAVELAPRNRRRKASFPLVTVDIEERDTSGTYRHADARNSFNAAVKGIPPDARAIIEALQPYRFPRPGDDPRDHGMAVLSQLQNADKHRELLVSLWGLKDTAVTIDGKMFGPARRPVGHEAELHRSGSHVDVEVSGSILVGLGESSDRAYEFARMPDLISFVRTEVIAPLEKFL